MAPSPLSSQCSDGHEQPTKTMWMSSSMNEKKHEHVNIGILDNIVKKKKARK
jgi:hypothetical protein